MKEVQIIYQRNKTRLCRLMGISDDVMFWLIADSGIEYLRAQCRYNQHGIDCLKSETFYWSWWVEQWHIRDAEFMAYHDLYESHAINRNSTILKSAYLAHHYEGINKDVLCTAYMHLVTEVFKPAKQKQYA